MGTARQICDHQVAVKAKGGGIEQAMVQAKEPSPCLCQRTVPLPVEIKESAWGGGKRY